MNHPDLTPSKRMTQSDMAKNIVAAIRKAGQVPMPYQEHVDAPACVAFYVDGPALHTAMASVEIFRKTLDATLASVGFRVYAYSTKPNKSSVHSSPAEWRDHHAKLLTFPDGSRTYVVYWPEMAWQRAFNPDPPLQLTLGGPNSPSVASASAVNARFGR